VIGGDVVTSARIWFGGERVGALALQPQPDDPQNVTVQPSRAASAAV
jgi:hypothetical protein